MTLHLLNSLVTAIAANRRLYLTGGTLLLGLLAGCRTSRSFNALASQVDYSEAAAAPQLSASEPGVLLESNLAGSIPSAQPNEPLTVAFDAFTERKEPNVAAAAATTPVIAPEETNVELSQRQSVEQQAPTVPARPMLRVRISNVRPGRGPLKIAFFEREAGFPDSSAARSTLQLDSAQPTVECSIEQPAQLAIAVYQDIDGDGQLSQNRRGIPTEPFAFSNNARGQRGPPSFAAACLNRPANLAADEQLTSIKLP